jgi:hypothetical protein
MKSKMEAASPPVVQEKWNGMEAAERDYEALLALKLAEAQKKAKGDETDALANPLMAKADELLKWCKDETDRLVDA